MLAFLFIIILCGLVTGGQSDSSYTVEIDNFEIGTEYDQKYVNWDTLGLKKKGRNKFIVGGTFSLNRNLADEQKINVQVFLYDKEKKAKGPLIFNMEKEVCKFVSENEDIYPGLRDKSNLPAQGTCPITKVNLKAQNLHAKKKNDYTIDDYEMNADFLPEDIPRGDYLLVFLLKDGLAPVAGFKAVITILD